MKVTHSLDVFTYEELPDEAKRRAEQALETEAWEDLDSFMVADDLAGIFLTWATGAEHYGAVTKKQLDEQYGARIYWSVAYGQGDHATIEGELHRHQLPNLAWPEGVEYAKVVTTGRGDHSNLEHIGVSEPDADDQVIYGGELFDATSEMILQLNRRLYSEARGLCEAYCDVEYLLQVIDEESPRRFTANGNVAPHEHWADA